MNQEEFKAMKDSGGLVSDADLQKEPTEAIIEEVDEEEIIEEDIAQIEQVEQENDELPELNEKEKTAFDKRLERERTKLEEKLRKEIEEQSEQKYSKHRAAVEAIGGDPDKIIAAAKESALKKEADRLAYQNGWDEDQTAWYIEDQKTKTELKELRVQRQIDKLKTDPDYAGIENMEKDIMTKIDKSGGQLTVDEAYWALGGAKKAAQIKLEAQMREQVKRAEKPRTVLTDNATPTTGEKPLPADVVKDMQRMRLTAAQARELMANDSPQTIEEYRARKKATGGS